MTKEAVFLFWNNYFGYHFILFFLWNYSLEKSPSDGLGRNPKWYTWWQITLFNQNSWYKMNFFKRRTNKHELSKAKYFWAVPVRIKCNTKLICAYGKMLCCTLWNIKKFLKLNNWKYFISLIIFQGRNSGKHRLEENTQKLWTLVILHT